MKQATFSVRMEEGLKHQFDDLCYEFGMNASTAFNMFARAVVRERKIPFEISAESYNAKLQSSGRMAFMALREQAQNEGLSNLSFEEINEEINKARSGI